MPSWLSLHLQTLQKQEGWPADFLKVWKSALFKSFSVSNQWLPVVHKPVSTFLTEKSSGINIPTHFSLFHPLHASKNRLLNCSAFPHWLRVSSFWEFYSGWCPLKLSALLPWYFSNKTSSDATESEPLGMKHLKLHKSIDFVSPGDQ